MWQPTSNVICVGFAVLTAGSNAAASVLQRRANQQAARDTPGAPPLHLSLIADLLRRRIWLAGIGMVMIAALFQAAALATGPIALVQPIFIIELPLALLLAAVLARINVSALPWSAIAMVTIGLGAGLAIASPSGGTQHASNGSWTLALLVTVAFEAALISLAVRFPGEPRAALLGLAAACGYALTAALLKDAMSALGQSAVAFLTAWQLYATALAGLGALFLLQNALQAGTLVASQPMLTVGDALISVSFGVTLFDEQLRTGWWLLPEIIAVTLIVAGCVQIAKSPLASQAVQPGR